MSSTDLGLLQRYASGGDAEAFAELMARHRDMVYAACYRVLGSRADAEDCAQECFVGLAHKSESVKTSVAGWLHRVAVRTSVAVRRRDRARRKTEREAASIAAGASAASSWDDVRVEIDRGIDKLPDKLREPLVLQFLEGKPQMAIAEELGLSQPTVSRRIRQGIEQLRGHLKQTGLAVSVGGLGALLSTNAVEAAPATLIAELGRMALAGVGSSSAPVGVAGSSLGVGALIGVKAKIACVVVGALAVGVALHQTVGGGASSDGQAAALAAAQPAAQLSGTEEMDSRKTSPEDSENQSSLVAPVTVPPALPAAESVPEPVAATLVAQAPAAAPAESVQTSKVDRTDAVAVVEAYLEACRKGDVEGAYVLIARDDPLRAVFREVANEMRGESAGVWSTPALVLREFTFLPVRFDLATGAVVAKPVGDEATVTVSQSLPLDKKFILRRDAEGVWSIDLIASIKASTGAEWSLLAERASRPEPETDESGQVDEGMRWECRGRIQILAEALTGYAAEHELRLPEAAAWMDDIEPYVMDKSAWKCPAEPGLEYGYAYNLDVAGTVLPTGWRESRECVLLFEWASGERNAAASASELLHFEPRHGEFVHFGQPNGWVDAALQGQMPYEALAANWQTEDCEAHVRRLCGAALRYARDNDGVLPGADSWCDDLAVYLLEAGGDGDFFSCPAAPELECAYAINADMAGKNARDMVDHGEIVLFMESDLGTLNASARVPGLAPEGRHRANWNRFGGRTVAGTPGRTSVSGLPRRTDELAERVDVVDERLRVDEVFLAEPCAAVVHAPDDLTDFRP